MVEYGEVRLFVQGHKTEAGAGFKVHFFTELDQTKDEEEKTGLELNFLSVCVQLTSSKFICPLSSFFLDCTNAF